MYRFRRCIWMCTVHPDSKDRSSSADHVIPFSFSISASLKALIARIGVPTANRRTTARSKRTAVFIGILHFCLKIYYTQKILP